MIIYNTPYRRAVRGLANGTNCDGNGHCVVSSTSTRKGKNPIQWGRNDDGSASNANKRVKYLYSDSNGRKVYETYTRNSNGSITRTITYPCDTCAGGYETITFVAPIVGESYKDDYTIVPLQDGTTPPDDAIDEEPQEPFEIMRWDSDMRYCGTPDNCSAFDDSNLAGTSKRTWYERTWGLGLDTWLYAAQPRRTVNGRRIPKPLWQWNIIDMVEPFYTKALLQNVQQGVYESESGTIGVRLPKQQTFVLVQGQQHTIDMYLPYVEPEAYTNLTKYEQYKDVYCAYNVTSKLSYLGTCTTCAEELLRKAHNSLLAGGNNVSSALTVSGIDGVNIKAMPQNFYEQLIPHFNNGAIDEGWEYDGKSDVRLLDYSKHSAVWSDRLVGYNNNTGLIEYDYNKLSNHYAYYTNRFGAVNNAQCNYFHAGTHTLYEQLAVRLNVSTTLPVGKHCFAISLYEPDKGIFGAGGCIVIHVLPPPRRLNDGRIDPNNNVGGGNTNFTGDTTSLTADGNVRFGNTKCCKCRTIETKEKWFLRSDRQTAEDVAIKVRKVTRLCKDASGNWQVDCEQLSTSQQGGNQ